MYDSGFYVERKPKSIPITSYLAMFLEKECERNYSENMCLSRGFVYTLAGSIGSINGKTVGEDQCMSV